MSPAYSLQSVIDLMVELAPPPLAAQWDNVGLMVGDPTRPLKGVVLAVDPTFEAVERTIALGANLLVTHHPLLFKAPKSLDLRREPGRTIQTLIKADVGLYAAHTNLDTTAVNVALAETIGLVGHQVLYVSGEHPAYKLAVFTPVSEVAGVLAAAWSAGAGQSSTYDRVAYTLAAQGTFRPLPGADPTQGQVGEQMLSDERRLEFLVTKDKLAAVKAAITKAHPYEEPAMDVIALVGAGEPYGFGLLGDLPRAESLEAFAKRVKQALGVASVRIVGDPKRAVKRAAWLGGSGGDYWPKALSAGADTYITGEVRHHAALDALAAGLTLIEVGHVGSEQPVVPFMARFLGERFGPGMPVHVLDQVDPFSVL